MKQSVRILLLALLGVDLALVLGFLVPYWLCAPGTVSAPALLQQEGEGYLLSWQEAPRATDYYVTITPEGAEEPAFSRYSGGVAQIHLPALPDGGKYRLKIQTEGNFLSLLGRQTRLSERGLEAVTEFRIPDTRAELSFDRAAHRIGVQALLPEGAMWQYQLTDSTGKILTYGDGQEATLTLTFGEQGDAPLPRGEDTYRFAYRLYRREGSLLLLGSQPPAAEIGENDLVWHTPTLFVVREEKNTCTLSWTGDQGQPTVLQELRGDSWETVATAEPGEQGSYSRFLREGDTPVFRAALLDGETAVLAASPEEQLSWVNPASASTVWLTKKCTVYSDPQGQTPAGELPQGTALWVLREENGFFGVWVNGSLGYIDSNLCMINLSEYLEGMCRYCITNSYSSAYTVHGFEIPAVTGNVLTGYEHVAQSDGSFLVPLLYPTAKKLYNAALAALDSGYRLKIYDSFRPGVTTQYIYDRTESILEDSLPVYTAAYAPKGTVTSLDTYEELMLGTGGSFALNSFLARGTSFHNYGIALDLTLENAAGEELTMQSAMHDLSWYAAKFRNGESANLLYTLMSQAGFGDLATEWWHFQDNETRTRLNPARLQNGLGAACWVQDDTGWRYRKDDGTFYVNQSAEIGGAVYTFDADGYITGNP